MAVFSLGTQRKISRGGEVGHRVVVGGVEKKKGAGRGGAGRERAGGRLGAAEVMKSLFSSYQLRVEDLSSQ